MKNDNNYFLVNQFQLVDPNANPLIITQLSFLDDPQGWYLNFSKTECFYSIYYKVCSAPVDVLIVVR